MEGVNSRVSKRENGSVYAGLAAGRVGVALVLSQRPRAVTGILRGWPGDNSLDSPDLFRPGRGLKRVPHPVLGLPGGAVCVSRSVVSDPLRPPRLWSPNLLCARDSPGKSTGAGCHVLLQGVFPAQGLNLDVLRARQSLYRLSRQGSPLLGLQCWLSFRCKARWFSYAHTYIHSSSGLFPPRLFWGIE